MLTFLLALALSQNPPVAPVSPAPPAPATSAPVPAVPAVPAVAPVDADAPGGKKETLAERQERIGCVVKTGSRIKRKDIDNCANGRSISKDDIDRAGGVFVAPGNAPVPAGAGG